MHAWSAAKMRLRRGLALGVVGLGASIAPLDFSVNIVFPAMAQAFGIQPTDIRWVAIGLVLTYGSLMLAFGALGDRIGHLRVFRAGLALAIVAFSVCTWAPDFSVMLAGRVLQGISVALVLSCAPALATRAFPEHSRTFALAAYGSLMAAAGILAPLIGSLSLLTVGWPGVFAVRIPLMALALMASSPRLHLLSMAPVEASPGPGEGSSAHAAREQAVPERIVPTGLPRSHPAWLALGLALLLMVPPLLGELGGAASARVTVGVILCSIGGVWILTRFIRAQRTLSRPFLPGAVATRRAFWRLQAAAVLIQFSSFALPLIAPFALLGALGQGALSSGALMSVWAVGTLAGSALMPRIIRGVGVARATQWSLWLASLGLFMVALWGQLPDLPWAVASLLVQGAALGLFQVGYGDQVIAALPAQARGVAGSLTMVTRTIGLVLGASLWIALLRAGGFMAVYLVAAGVLLVFGSLTRRREHWSITS
jgi:MFS family permease